MERLEEEVGAKGAAVEIVKDFEPEDGRRRFVRKYLLLFVCPFASPWKDIAGHPRPIKETLRLRFHQRPIAPGVLIHFIQ